MISIKRFLVGTFIIFSFISCVNISAGSVYIEEKDKGTDAGTAVLSASITNLYEDSPVFSVKSSRTIMPDALSDSEIYGFDFYIKGELASTAPKNFGPVKITVGDGTNGIPKGTFTYTLERGVWNITLFAVDSGTSVDSSFNVFGSDKTYMVGFSCADLSQGNASVSFTMTEDSLTSNGSIDLTLMLQASSSSVPWAPNISYHIGDIATTSIVITDISNGKPIVPAKNINFNNSAYNYVEPDVPKGTYNVALDFKNSSGESIGNFSDTITVLSNRETNSVVYIPDVIGKKPLQPGYLNAYYEKDSEDSLRNGFYKVTFVWDNNAVNEKYYKLTLDVIDGAASVAGYTPVSSTDYTFSNFAARGEYGSGSLLANSTELTLYLQLGHEYFARICAVNDLGESDETPLTLTSTVPASLRGRNFVCFADGSTPDQLISRYRISYDFDGGSYLRTAVEQKNRNVEYRSARNAIPASYPLWAGNGYDDTMADHSDDLMYQSRYLKEWYVWEGISKVVVADIDSSGLVYSVGHKTHGTDFSLTGYSGYSNVEVFANYKSSSSNVSGSITYDNPDDYKFLGRYISYACSNPSVAGVCAAGSATSGAVTLSKAAIDSSGAETVVFAVTVPSDENIPSAYDSISLKFRDSSGSLVVPPQSRAGAPLGSVLTFAAIDIAPLDNGSYTAAFECVKNNSGSVISRSVSIVVFVSD